MGGNQLVAGAIVGALALPPLGARAAEGRDVWSPGVHLVFSFGQGFRVGLGLDLRYTRVLNFEHDCEPRQAWQGIGAFGQATWLIHDGFRIAVGAHVAGELSEHPALLDAELGWSYTLTSDWQGHGLQAGLVWGYFPIDIVIARANLSFEGDTLRPEGQLGFGARAPGTLGSRGDSCIIGRPLRVDGHQRLATYAVGAPGRATLRRVAPETRLALGASWLEAARAEAASVPAFLALARDLAQVGAPARLIARSRSAARDEVRHARMCEVLAGRAYARPIRTLQPELPTTSATDRSAMLQRLALESWHDGCLGEASAARRAALAFATCRDDRTRHALGHIVRDEHAHAELAWSVLTYALEAGGRVVRDGLVAALEEAPAAIEEDAETRGAATSDAREWATHGRLDRTQVTQAQEAVDASARRRAWTILDRLGR